MVNKYSSTTVSEDSVTVHPTNEEISLSFDIARGSSTVSINEPLLTNYEVAEARATSIFLDSSYTTKRVVVETYHIDRLNLGDTIEIDSILYIIQSISDKIIGAKASMILTCERWE